MSKFSMQCKELMVQEISRRLNDSDTLIVTNYKGLSAKDMNELRKELRNISGEYVVVKDSVTKRALAESPNSSILEFIEGEVGIAIDKKEEPTYISKVLVKFSKVHEVLKIRGGIIDGGIVSKDVIQELAALPSREVLLGKLANVVNAPLQGLASSLHQIIAKLVYVLGALKDKKPAKREPPKEEPKAEAKPEAKPEIKVEPKPEAKPETKEDTEKKEEEKKAPQPEAKETDKKPEVKPETQDKGTREQKPDTQNKEE